MDDVPARVEHTVLGPTTTSDDVRRVVTTADRLGMRACVPPGFVRVATAAVDGDAVPITTVVDFPHGTGANRPVRTAARTAVDDGAAEIDLVAPVGRLLGGEPQAVHDRIAAVATAVPVPLKVILQTPRLDADERDRLAGIAADAGADYLKTATGYADGGATVADVAALAEVLPVKASGGIGSWERAAAMFDAGATRIGASAGDAIVEEWRAATQSS